MKRRVTIYVKKFGLGSPFAVFPDDVIDGRTPRFHPNYSRWFFRTEATKRIALGTHPVLKKKRADIARYLRATAQCVLDMRPLKKPKPPIYHTMSFDKETRKER